MQKKGNFMQPDSTFFDTIFHDPGNLIELIALVVATISLLITVIPKTYRWWRNYRDRRSLKKRLGAELYTKEDILRATKFYIKPNCQDVDPSQEEEIRLVHAVKNKLFETVDELLKNAEKFKYLIVLADSGMGKTAFVLNYYARHWRSYFRRRKFKIALVPLGIKDADSHIKKIEDQSNTVLFLDAFDEDTRAILNHRLRLANLLGLCSGFRQVLVTSRTQFFEKEEEIPRETGIVRFGITSAGENREYVFYKLYLSPFSDVQVKKYLKRRFHFWQRNKCRRAREIIAKIPQLTVRPMLLAHIHDLVQTQKQYRYSFQIYEEMVDAWLERERPFVKDKTELRKFSEQLAIDLFQKRTERESERVPFSELEPLARSFGINLKDWQLRGRSLLNRDVAGNYKFAHRSIMEYLFVKRFLELKPVERFKIAWTDQMKKFLKEILAIHADRKLPPPDLTHVDLEGIVIFRSQPATLSVDQVKTMLKNYNFFDSSRNESGQGFSHNFEMKSIKDEKAVLDRASNLMWQQGGSSNSMKFKRAKKWIYDLNNQKYAGYTDWRLPTLEEAMSLMEPKKNKDGLFINPIFDSKQRWIWTSDPYTGAAGRQWVVGFGSGGCDDGILYGNYYVRAVRFGQSSPE
jgi:hypothetical protein